MTEQYTPSRFITYMRIVDLKKAGKSFTDIAYILNSEAGRKFISPQRCQVVYTQYRDEKFEIIEKGKNGHTVIIH